MTVVDTAAMIPLRGRKDRIERDLDPFLLVAEVWSPSTGTYDVDVRLDAYKQRGDREIWRLQPHEHALTAWVWQESRYREQTDGADAIVVPTWLPNVAIDLAALFAVIR